MPRSEKKALSTRMKRVGARGDGDAGSDFLAQILIRERVLTPSDLRRLNAIQRAMPDDAREPIGRLAVREGFISDATLQSILDREGHRLHLGELLVLRGMISIQQLHLGIREQAASGELLGEVLIRLGLLDPVALAEGLAEQAGIARVPISTVPIDSKLAGRINPTFAATHGMVPVASHGRCLLVAIWNPRSLAVVPELEQAMGCQIQVVLTTRSEVEERIQALYLAGAGDPPDARETPHVEETPSARVAPHAEEMPGEGEKTAA